MLAGASAPLLVFGCLGDPGIVIFCPLEEVLYVHTLGSSSPSGFLSGRVPASLTWYVHFVIAAFSRVWSWIGLSLIVLVAVMVGSVMWIPYRDVLLWLTAPSYGNVPDFWDDRPWLKGPWFSDDHVGHSILPDVL